jgi:hypothetical protein
MTSSTLMKTIDHSLVSRHCGVLFIVAIVADNGDDRRRADDSTGICHYGFEGKGR